MEGKQPLLQLLELWEPSTYSTYTQALWKPLADFTWYPTPRSLQVSSQNLYSEADLVLGIPFATSSLPSMIFIVGFFCRPLQDICCCPSRRVLQHLLTTPCFSCHWQRCSLLFGSHIPQSSAVVCFPLPSASYLPTQEAV